MMKDEEKNIGLPDAISWRTGKPIYKTIMLICWLTKSQKKHTI